MFYLLHLYIINLVIPAFSFVVARIPCFFFTFIFIFTFHQAEYTRKRVGGKRPTIVHTGNGRQLVRKRNEIV